MTDLRVISGGQVGVDIAGLRAAHTCGITTGGWMPKGYLTKVGPRPEYRDEFGMRETESSEYPPRTEANVAEADFTIRIATDFATAGEQCTLRAIKKHGKPHADFNVDWKGQLAPGIDEFELIELFSSMLVRAGYRTINVAGNAKEALEKPIMYFLKLIFARWKAKT